MSTTVTTAQGANKTISVKAEDKTLTFKNTITGAQVVLKVEDGKVIRDISTCTNIHDKQYGGCIAHFVSALTTKYMNKRLSWADRLKKIERECAKIDAKSIRNLSSKMRVVLNPVFIPNEAEWYFAEQVAKIKTA